MQHRTAFQAFSKVENENLEMHRSWIARTFWAHISKAQEEFKWEIQRTYTHLHIQW